jgi:hypothetical protein
MEELVEHFLSDTRIKPVECVASRVGERAAKSEDVLILFPGIERDRIRTG